MMDKKEERARGRIHSSLSRSTMARARTRMVMAERVSSWERRNCATGRRKSGIPTLWIISDRFIEKGRALEKNGELNSLSL